MRLRGPGPEGAPLTTPPPHPNPQHGTDALVAGTDEPVKFAENVVAAYTDPDLWRKVRAAGVVNMETYFGIGSAAAGLGETLEVALEGRAGASAQVQHGAKAIQMRACS